MKNLIKKINKFIIYSYLNVDFKKKENIVDFLIEDLYLKIRGFKSKKKLKDFIVFNVFEGQNLKLKNISKKESKNIISSIESIFKKCNSLIELNKDLKIVILPTNQSFVSEKMKGSTGYTVSAETMFIFINPKSINLKTINNTIKKTFVHEYNHAARIMYFPKINSMSLLDNLVFEGLADNFQKMVIKGSKVPPWSRSLSRNEAKIIFNEIIEKIQSKKESNFFELFFENKKYPLWAGYSIGYYIVDSFLKNNSNNEWKEIVKLKSVDILKKSDW